jgi:hypothetical protein
LDKKIPKQLEKRQENSSKNNIKYLLHHQTKYILPTAKNSRQPLQLLRFTVREY